MAKKILDFHHATYLSCSLACSVFCSNKCAKSQNYFFHFLLKSNDVRRPFLAIKKETKRNNERKKQSSHRRLAATVVSHSNSPTLPTSELFKSIDKLKLKSNGKELCVPYYFETSMGTWMSTFFRRWSRDSTLTLIGSLSQCCRVSTKKFS